MASGDNIESIEVLETPFALIANNSKERTANNETVLDIDDKDHLSANKYTGQDATQFLQRTPSTMPHTRTERERDKDRKIGHRRVGVGGEITYKKIQTTQIMGSIQLGIQHAVGGLASKPERDLLMQDFMTVETTNFPSEGSNHTPAHHYSEFKYKNYAPIAFRYFRDLFGIQPDDFLMSMCSSPLRALTSPGASGSIFYLTNDDEFIIKTVQHKEGEFLQKLLAGYYMNLNQNPRTLLPKFFGLYCYQCNSKNVRLVVMNNLLPSSVTLHQKYDLKGSTYKRKASKAEKAKRSPTYKDLDFMEHHPEGILMEADTYAALIKTIQRDCRVLESFKIMDYSLLVGVHNMDQSQKEKLEKRSQSNLDYTVDDDDMTNNGASAMADASMTMLHGERDREREDRVGAAGLNRTRSINRQRLVAHSTAMESIQAESEPIDEDDDSPPGGIPARNSRGERLLLYIGVIDILQSYRLKKKLEHSWKSLIHDGDTVSVHRPSFYAQRFQEFMAKRVFKKIPSLDLPEIKGNHRKFRTLVTSYIALKHSPSKRKSLSKPLRPLEEMDSAMSPTDPKSTAAPVYPSYPPSSSTPPPIYTPPISCVTVEDTVGCNTGVGPTASVMSVQSPSGTATGYPAVLVGRPNAAAEASGKVKVPPPVPPRGTPKTKRGPPSEQAVKGGVAGVVPSCCSTPPPPFTDVLAEEHHQHHHHHHRSSSSTGDVESPVAPPVRGSRISSSAHHHHHHTHNTVMESRGSSVKGYREDAISVTDIRLESRPDNKSSLSVESGSSSGVGCGTVGSGSGGHSSSHSGRTGSGAPLAWTPPASVEGSTPTWTEGTPSFTESSSSGDMGCPTTPLRHDGTPGAAKSSSATSVPQQMHHHLHHGQHQHKKTVERAITCLTTEMKLENHYYIEVTNWSKES